MAKQRKNDRLVNVEVTQEDVLNDDGDWVDGVCARCTRCNHETESWGTSIRSVRRCLALLREECPEQKKLFYVNRGPFFPEEEHYGDAFIPHGT